MKHKQRTEKQKTYGYSIMYCENFKDTGAFYQQSLAFKKKS